MNEAGHELGILHGDDSAFNALHAKPEIAGWADQRGKTLIVDAPNTAWSKMLDTNCLPRGSYTIQPSGGTFARHELMFNDPNAHASRRKLAGVTDVVGPYLDNAGWAMHESIGTSTCKASTTC